MICGKRRQIEGTSVLRRAENVSMRHRVNLFTRRGRVELTVGRSTYYVGAKLRKDELSEAFASSDRAPVKIGRVKERQYWWFRSRWFWDNDNLLPEQVFALLETRDRRQAATIARAHTIANSPAEPVQRRRGAVPRDIQELVWARDGGRCNWCGTTSELQFDHVIPFSRGGSNEPGNLQVLCGPCNRRKGVALG